MPKHAMTPVSAVVTGVSSAGMRRKPMPSDACYRHKNLSAEFRKWSAHYKALGCGSQKVEKLV